MATYTVNDKTEGHIPDRLNVVESVIDMLKTERNYVAIEALGSGTYGDVFKLFNPENQTHFAAKIVTHQMITEAESLLWPSLDHPNIVPLTEYVDLSIVKAAVYLMPMQETSLGAMMVDNEFRMQVDALDQVKKWLGQTLCGLEYLHNKDLVHLDVKEDNVLISHCSTAMLCDFTCLNKVNKPIRSGKVGSPFMYKSPEAFYKGGTVEGKSCDIWAFGIMTVEILTDFFLSNNLPFIEHNWLMDVHPTLNEILQEQVFKTYFDGTFLKVEKNEDKVSRMALDFIHGFLKMDPSERVTSSEAKQHPFLNGGTDVVNAPDDIWNSELYMGGSELDDCFCSLGDDEIGFSNEDVSNEGSDFLNMSLEDFNTSADNFTDLKYEYEVPELDYETSQTASKVRVCSETTFAFESTHKFATDYGIPLSEIIRNLRLRIKDLIENFGDIKREKMSKAQSIADKVYFQSEDNGLKSKETNTLQKGVKSISKFTVEDCATGSKSTSLEATLEFVVAIKTLLKNYEDVKVTKFLSIDVSSKKCQMEIPKINLVGHNCAEANLPVDSTSATVLETRGHRQRIIGWLQSKCVSVLKFCCPCMAVKNSSEDM